MDADLICADIDKWARRVFKTAETTTVEVPSRVPHTFKVTWKVASDTVPSSPKITVLADSLKVYVAPHAQLTNYSDKECTLVVHVAQLPDEIVTKIKSGIRAKSSAIAWSARFPLKFHIGIFIASLSALMLSLLILHNHWHGFEEPWENPLEFITYHLNEYLPSFITEPSGRLFAALWTRPIPQ